MQFLSTCLSLEKKSKSEHLKDIIFFLSCSIIQEIPNLFWTDSSKFDPIYAYII